MSPSGLSKTRSGPLVTLMLLIGAFSIGVQATQRPSNAKVPSLDRRVSLIIGITFHIKASPRA